MASRAWGNAAHSAVGLLAFDERVAAFDQMLADAQVTPDLEPAIVPPLLELLIRSSEHQQIVLLTEDPTIASWARLEAMTGNMSLVEPSPEPSTSSEVALWDPSVVHLR